MGTLILSRHHESEWNKIGKWTGSRDRHLTEYGFKKSEELGASIKDFPIDFAFASMQVRSIETLSCILNTKEEYHVPIEHCIALNERDYGDYTGKNKEDMERLLGEEEYTKLRRGWDYPIPHGETLKMVSARTVPFMKEKVLPLVMEANTVLVVAHGNSLRTIVKFLENIPDEGITQVEFPFGDIFIYDIDPKGIITHKEIRSLRTTEIA